jgi:hypothetical protein
MIHPFKGVKRMSPKEFEEQSKGCEWFAFVVIGVAFLALLFAISMIIIYLMGIFANA